MGRFFHRVFNSFELNELLSAASESLHPFVVRPAAAFGRHPINDLVGIGDVARLAVDAI